MSATTLACSTALYAGSMMRTAATVSGYVGTLLGKFSFDSTHVHHVAGSAACATTWYIFPFLHLQRCLPAWLLAR
jgi:hypothetical protein